MIRDDRGVRPSRGPPRARRPGPAWPLSACLSPFLAGAAYAATPCSCPAQGSVAAIAQRRWTEARSDPCLGVPVGVPRSTRVRSAISVRSVNRLIGPGGAAPVWAPRTQRCLWRNVLRSTAVRGRSVPESQRGPAVRPLPLPAGPGHPRGCRGPWWHATVRLLKYWPLAALGRARLTASISAARLSSSCSGSKLALPNGTWMIPPLSTLNSTRPPLTSLIGALQVERDRCPTWGWASGRAGRGCGRACRPCPSCRASRARRRTRASRPRCA